HCRRVRATTGQTSGAAARAAAREDLSALTGETGGDTEARRRNEKSRHSIGPRPGGSTGPGAEDESHLRTVVCGLLVRISTRPIATHGDAEGMAGNPRGQLLDFRRRLARLLGPCCIMPPGS